MSEKPIDTVNPDDRTKHLDNVLESLGVIVWSATYPDLVLIQISPSDRIFPGLKAGQTISSTGVLQQYVYSEDIHIVKTAAKQRELGKKSFAQYRIVLDNGSIRRVHEYSHIRYGEDNHPVQVNGIITDVTDCEPSVNDTEKYEQIYRPLSTNVAEHKQREEMGLADITTRVNAEEYLLYARAAADESNRMKTEMIQNISHELRTPLISVLGFSDVLLSDSENFSEVQKKFLRNIHESGNKLDDIVEKFLDFSHTEQESVDFLYPQSVDLKRTIQGTCDLLSIKASKKNIDINIVIDPNINTIVADPYKLKTILFNLIENAIKFTDTGGSVKIEAKISNDEILFSVHDTGIGMAEDKLESIFEPFIQIDGSKNRRYGGTGLGLALVKKLIEMHGGHIRVESELGKGSNFIFSIPLEESEKE